MKNLTKTLHRYQARERRKKAIRKTLFGTAEAPRLVVFRSLKHIYGQVIDDSIGKTLTAASTKTKDINLDGITKKQEQSFQVGLLLGKQAIKLGIKKITFDRGGYLYHGRVKALAAGVRKAGVEF